MKHKALYLLVAMALGGVGAAHAQDSMSSNDHGSSMDNTSMSANDSMMSDSSYDNRWYIAPTIGGYYNDTDRNTNSRQLYESLGFGRFISPNASIDFFFDHTERDRDAGGHWNNNNYGLAARFYAGSWDAWRPYALIGIMASERHNPVDSGFAPAAELGLGLSKTITDRTDLRVEAAYRYEWDNSTQPSESGYGDWLLGLGLAIRLGPNPVAPPPPAAAPPPPAPQPSCDQLDGDNDGVNNCDDQCPSTAAGTIVGPDGCKQKVVIDLRGVNFKFDRPSKGETSIASTLQKPTSDSMDVLNQAVDTLKRYPNVEVMVAGYTDSIGTDSYNQGLSERRAKIVYNYLTSHGVSASRLDGPLGHGESNPVASNSTKDGRARNRRTELQVENQK